MLAPNTIFYDTHCPFCQKRVEKIQNLDHQHMFVYKGLQEAKAYGQISRYADGSTLIFFEKEGKIWVRGKAIFRIYALLGKKWPGILYHLPAIFLDPIYRIIARVRHYL